MTTEQGPILVIGATGNQDEHVAQALLETGWRVHAFTRNPTSPKAHVLKAHGAHLIVGDLGDLPSLAEAIQHVAGVFSVQNFWDLGLNQEVRLGSHVIEAALKAGNHPHIVYSSGLGAEVRQNFAAIDGKAILEEKLRKSKLPFTILRPGLFMDDFLGASLSFARPIQRRLEQHRPLVGRLFLASLRAVVPSGRPIPLTTLRDVGRTAAWAFEHPDESPGKTYEVIGSSETAETLSTLWTQITGQPIPHMPGLRAEIRLGHPRLLALLQWIGREQKSATLNTPCQFQPYVE